jgi:membrane-bound metal-dependent hydrolase YbcI (DUF457 family)
MFLGHIAVGFASKRLAPRTSLGWLMTAPMLLDLLWPLFLIAGIEQVRISPGDTAFTPLEFVSYPWTHSLLMALVWASLFMLAYLARTGYTAGAFWLGIGVASHWVLDWVSHRPDLPLVPWSPVKVGLGLWNSVPATIVVESAMFVAALGVYLATTRAKRWTGHLSLWSFVGLMVLAYIGNEFGPPPPSVEALRTLALVTWLFVPWAFWIERTREVRAPAA